MNNNQWKLAGRPSGFTLGEMILITAIIAILAVTLLPVIAFDSHATEAKQRTLQYYSHEIREKLSDYRADHQGRLPKLSDGQLPQLTSQTEANGSINTNAPYGPYFPDSIPNNPFNGNNLITLGTGIEYIPGGAGWQYDPTTGGIWPNNRDYYAP